MSSCPGDRDSREISAFKKLKREQTPLLPFRTQPLRVYHSEVASCKRINLGEFSGSIQKEFRIIQIIVRATATRTFRTITRSTGRAKLISRLMKKNVGE